MPAHKINSYWKAITVIEAQDTLLKLRIAVYPKQKPGEQKKFFDRIYRQAYPNQEKKNVLKAEDFVKVMKAKGMHG